MPWRCILTLAFLLVGEAHGKVINLRYGLGTGPMVEFGTDHFGFGLNQITNNYSGTAANSYNIAMTITSLRLSYYVSGFGQDSWYFAAAGGQMRAAASQTVSATKYSNETTATAWTAGGGYHWFWNVLNVHAGLSAVSLQFPATTMTSAGGSVSETIDAFTFTLPLLEVGIGVAF